MDEGPATIEGATLLAESAALQWHEAVSVVLQLAGAVRQTATSAVPDLSHVRLFANGAVEILPGSPPSTDLVTPLAASLRLLLERAPGPFELGQFVKEAAEGRFPGHDLDRFVISLNYYERPGRQQVLRNLVERLAPIEAEARAATELKRLEAKAREGATTPAPPTKKQMSAEARRRTLVIVAFAVVVVMIGGFVVAWWQFRPALTTAGKGVRTVVTRAGHGIVQAFNSGVDRLFGPAQQPPQPVADSATSAPKPAPRPRPKKEKPKDGMEVADTAAPPELVLLPTLILPSAVLTPPNEIFIEAPPPPIVATVPAVDADRVYTAADRGVTPPVPLQPLLGRPTTDVKGVPGDMEVLVSATGVVERVTLLVPNAYQDRFMVYAMKARRFKPGMADGRPVRYLIRIRTAF